MAFNCRSDNCRYLVGLFREGLIVRLEKFVCEKTGALERTMIYCPVIFIQNHDNPSCNDIHHIFCRDHLLSFGKRVGINVAKHFLIIIVLSAPVIGLSQVRFYAQFKNVPFREAGTSTFAVLTGVKLDPNKEILLGWGLLGSLNPSTLRGELRFNKSSFNTSFNYYLSRVWYLNGEVNANLLRGIVTDLLDDDLIVGAGRNLLKRAFFDYNFNMTFVVMRRLHFSFGTGVVNFAKLVRDTTQDFLQAKFQLNVALALKVYVFQIKY